MENTKNLLCSCCDTPLVYTHSERYQDLAEHVSQPNREPSVKPAFQCLNTECIANQCDVAWIEDGEYYTGKRPEGISYTQLNDALKEKHGTAFAVNSWNYHYELGKLAIKARQKIIRIGKYRVDIEPKEYGHDYPTEKQYQPKRFGWKFQYWKETEDGRYTSIIPIYQMVKYYIRQFNMHYRNILQNPDQNKSSIKNALDISKGNVVFEYTDAEIQELAKCASDIVYFAEKYAVVMTDDGIQRVKLRKYQKTMLRNFQHNINCIQWGSKDDRSFARISSFIVRTVYFNKVKFIKEISKSY